MKLWIHAWCVVLLVSISFISVVQGAAGLSVGDLKCEYKTDPVGIDVLKPRLSWTLKSDARNVLQTAYQIRVARSRAQVMAGENPVWDSGRVASDQSIHRVYAGPAPSSRQRLFWQVRVWDDQGRVSQWSQPGYWEMGLCTPADWRAHWIEPGLPEDPKVEGPSPLLRREFVLSQPVQRARAYVTCHGLYEMQINGKGVGDQVLAPGWTAYDKRLQYQTYNVTDCLKQGGNAVGVMLGDGWFRGNLAWRNNRNVFGQHLALLLQIEVVHPDGSRTVIGTDDTWKVTTGPIRKSDIYDGETYDARLEQGAWTQVHYDDSAWKRVRLAQHSKEVLVAPAGPPIRRIEEIKPIKILKTPDGDTVVDMGQNMVGWLRIQVQGPAGTEVTMRHAEVLDAKGNLYTENLRAADQTNRYILKGGGVEVYEPHFTFQGFRYVAIDGWPGVLTLDNITGVVVHSDIPRTGWFECSDPLVNQLQHNIRWGQKGNFVGVPTDCPQRDERLGWTGDAQAFARTACFNAQVAGFYTKWLADLAADQKANGAVPHVIPDVLSRGQARGGASAGWADAAVIVPWTVYLCYDDTRILKQQYPSMKAWVDYMATRAGDTYFWNMDATFGDWLAFNTTRSDYPGATTDKDLICQAYFARSTDLVRRTALVLGKQADAQKYGELLKKVKKVFQEEFVTPRGRLSSNTQTAYALALAFDLLPQSRQASAARRLAEDVRRFKHITTGFLGTPVICHVLSDYGYSDEAFMLLMRKDYPSWLYPITKGATTIWERWDGIKPDGSFQDKGMNSFNHYAYGAIGDWLYRVVAGIEIDEHAPGYKHILIQPHMGGGLTHAQARIDSMYGPVESGWFLNGKQVKVSIAIPANTRATVRLPQARLDQVRLDGKPLTESGAEQVSDAVMLNVGSGQYVFEYGL